MRDGKVRLVYRHFIIFGERSLRAAAAAEAAAQQGAFWQYHDRLFEARATQDNAAFTDAGLRAIAVDLGLNLDAFEAAWNDRATTERVKAEWDEGRRLGVSSTPTVFVSGRKIEGALPYPIYKSAIDEALRS